MPTEQLRTLMHGWSAPTAQAAGRAASRLESSRWQSDIEARRIVSMPVHAVGMEEAVRRVVHAASRRCSSMVCVANVHMVMEAHDDPAFARQLDSADLVVPDGMPLVWMLRRLGMPGQPRIAGPKLMPALCDAAALAEMPVGFLGGQAEVLDAAIEALRARTPGLKVAFAVSPPYRPMDEAEDTALVAAINESGAAILFVALGCPKQEQWIHAHRGRVQAVMVGIGAALDFAAGAVARAPASMQACGLEWLFRLIQEPGRLWRRYLWHNPRFVGLALADLLAARPARSLAHGDRMNARPR